MIISLSVVEVLALCITVICLAKQTERLETVKLVFSAALPLLASWVGTILAYYFSKDNFLAATRSVTQLARTVSGMEKLPAWTSARSNAEILLQQVKHNRARHVPPPGWQIQDAGLT